jgi:hypothetical protein
MLDRSHDLLVDEAVAKTEWLAEQCLSTDDIERVPTRVVDQAEGGLKREYDSSVRTSDGPELVGQDCLPRRSPQCRCPPHGQYCVQQMLCLAEPAGFNAFAASVDSPDGALAARHEARQRASGIPRALRRMARCGR